jgi:membrane-associated phospholipid phosphatase
LPFRCGELAGKDDTAMPPLFQDPLSAVAGAQWTWVDVARALVDVSCEAWAIALIALAVYSFLERDVKSVLETVAPLALALTAAAALAAAARALGGVPRPVAGAGHALGPLLHRAFPSAQTAAVAAFAAYTALAYGRRALAAVLVVAAVGIARALGGPHWAAELAASGVAGAALGAIAHAVTVRLAPGGHLARLKAGRQGRAAPADPGST